MRYVFKFSVIIFVCVISFVGVKRDVRAETEQVRPVEQQLQDGQQDYLGDYVWDFVAYQPFDAQINGGGDTLGNWQEVGDLYFKTMAVLSDVKYYVYLKMALNPDGNCDGEYQTDWNWATYGTATATGDGVWRETIINNINGVLLDDTCGGYWQTNFCSICGIGFYIPVQVGVMWVELGSAGDYPKMQLDIQQERVSDYSMYFLLDGTVNGNVDNCNCASSSNIFYEGICNGFCWLFYPTDYGLTTFQNNYDNLKQSFPFNTYFELTGAVQDAVSSTTMTTTNTIGIPFVKTTAGHAQYYVAPVLSSSSLPNAIGGTNANLVRNTLSYFFWLIAGAIAVILFIKF